MTLWLAIVFAVALLLPSNAWAASWKEKVLYSFQGGPDGQTPQGGVVFDQQGNWYGTTINGFQDGLPVTSEINNTCEVLNALVKHLRPVRVEGEAASFHLLSSVRPAEIRVLISQRIDAIAFFEINSLEEQLDSNPDEETLLRVSSQ